MLGRGSLVGFWVVTLVGALVLPARGAGLPAGWANQDIGSVTRPGSTAYDAAKDTWTVIGEGSDIWGNSDDHQQYAYTQLKGDGQITAHVLAQTGGHDDGWARNGLQIREDLDPDSPLHASFIPAEREGTGYMRCDLVAQSGPQPAGELGAVMIFDEPAVCACAVSRTFSFWFAMGPYS